MDNFLEILLYILIGCWLLLSIGLLLCYNNTTYNYIWLHKEYKMWNYYNKHADDFRFLEKVNDAYYFENDLNEYAIVWKNGSCTIHNATTCLCTLCAFYKRGSMKMAEKLIQKIEY